MKLFLAGVLALLILELNAPPADACEVKLVLKTSTPPKAVARSANPSNLLLVGTPPYRLERELAAAGHDVEVAPAIGSAKRNTYAVVVVLASQVDETRAKFPGAIVLVRSGDVSKDIGSVEEQVAGRPTVVATKEPGPATGAPAKEPTPANVTTTVQPPAETPAGKEPPVGKEAPPAKDPVAAAPAKTVAPKPFREEIYFGLAKAAGGRASSLRRAARWMTENPSLHVTIEGYADPSGDHAVNMALSQTRAESVRDFLVAAGIDASRLEVIAYGDTKLKYGQADPRNRRVAIVPKP